jgi:hypothetical protein
VAAAAGAGLFGGGSVIRISSTMLFISAAERQTESQCQRTPTQKILKAGGRLNVSA